MSEYELYGDEWKREMMKMSKEELVAMLKKEFSNQEKCLISSVDFQEKIVSFDMPRRLRGSRWGGGILRVNFTDVIHDS